MENSIHIEKKLHLNRPILIAGFQGWGNALDVANSAAAYLIRSLKASRFASLDPDAFYRFDESRPEVVIEDGCLKNWTAADGVFYAAINDSGDNDFIILKAHEPHIGWFRFANSLFGLCRDLKVHTVITLGSMLDSVLHTDRTVSGIASDEKDLERLKALKVIPINYSGPSAIHSLIHSEAVKQSIRSISLWYHCPYYLQNIVHFGAIAHLGRLIADFLGFEVDTGDLEVGWEELSGNIQKLIDENPKIQDLIDSLRREKVRGSWKNVKAQLKTGDNVIDLRDFLEK